MDSTCDEDTKSVFSVGFEIWIRTTRLQPNNIVTLTVPSNTRKIIFFVTGRTYYKASLFYSILSPSDNQEVQYTLVSLSDGRQHHASVCPLVEGLNCRYGMVGEVVL